MIEEFPPNKLADREGLKDSGIIKGIEEFKDWGIQGFRNSGIEGFRN